MVVRKLALWPSPARPSTTVFKLHFPPLMRPKRSSRAKRDAGKQRTNLCKWGGMVCLVWRKQEPKGGEKPGRESIASFTSCPSLAATACCQSFCIAHNRPECRYNLRHKMVPRTSAEASSRRGVGGGPSKDLPRPPRVTGRVFFATAAGQHHTAARTLLPLKR